MKKSPPMLQLAALLILATLCPTVAPADDKARADACEERMAKVQEELTSLAGTLEKIQKEIDKRERVARETEKKLATAEAARAKALREIEQLKSGNGQLERLKSSLAAQQKAAEDTAELAKALQEKLEHARQVNAAASARIAELEKNMAIKPDPATSTQLLTLDTRIKELAAENNDLKTQFKTTTELATAREAQLREMQAKLEQSMTACARAESKLLESEASLAIKAAGNLPAPPLPKRFEDEPATIPPIFCEPGDSDLGGERTRVLADVRQALTVWPDATIEISGHASGEGDQEINMKLSAQRAQALADFLEENGVSEERMLLIAEGDTTPLADNESEEGRQKNRRVEVRVIPVPKALKK